MNNYIKLLPPAPGRNRPNIIDLHRKIDPPKTAAVGLQSFPDLLYALDKVHSSNNGPGRAPLLLKTITIERFGPGGPQIVPMGPKMSMVIVIGHVGDL